VGPGLLIQLPNNPAKAVEIVEINQCLTSHRRGRDAYAKGAGIAARPGCAN
jgi:hypothetical protein